MGEETWDTVIILIYLKRAQYKPHELLHLTSLYALHMDQVMLKYV